MPWPIPDTAWQATAEAPSHGWHHTGGIVRIDAAAQRTFAKAPARHDNEGDFPMSDKACVTGVDMIAFTKPGANAPHPQMAAEAGG
ncbi:hypothetical protein [Acidovorax sacchari]|uniref:hypothetical protein n=1 Tax=Acidovorax sacchari TaxID=3230736 RepID=UPI0039E44A20